MSFTGTWMQLETRKDKYQMFPLVCGTWILYRYKTTYIIHICIYTQIYNMQVSVYLLCREAVGTNGWGSQKKGEGMGWIRWKHRAYLSENSLLSPLPHYMHWMNTNKKNLRIKTSRIKRTWRLQSKFSHALFLLYYCLNIFLHVLAHEQSWLFATRRQNTQE